MYFYFKSCIHCDIKYKHRLTTFIVVILSSVGTDGERGR